MVEPGETPRWDHFNPVRITCGPGAVDSVSELVPGVECLLLVTTAGFTLRGGTSRLVEQLGSHRVVVFDQVVPNPEIDDLDLAIQALRPKAVQGILAVGGGSALDFGKILGVALSSRYPRPLRKTLSEGALPDWTSKLPVIAIPTTSGTGAEVTPFATVWDRRFQKKHSLSGPLIYPVQAILDPNLTLSLPENETLFSGLDTFSHALESLWNRHRTPLSSAFSLQALEMGLQALPVLLHDPASKGQRAKMQQASLMAGLAISQTRTAIAHSISYPFTSHFGVPHGLACAFTLPLLLERYLMLDVGGQERGLLQKALAFLSSLDLAGYMSRFVAPGQCEMIWSEMHHPGRADNFIIEVAPCSIRQIVLDSLRCQCS